jgi:dihydrofolate reductase
MTKDVPQFSIIVAATPEGGIGSDQKLPWSLKGDMKFFRDMTISHEKQGGINKCIMGIS